MEGRHKNERRVRFADSMGRELVSIFLIDLISTFYHHHYQPAITASSRPVSKTLLSKSSSPSSCSTPSTLSKTLSSITKTANTYHSEIKKKPPSPTTLRARESSPKVEAGNAANATVRTSLPRLVCEFTQPISLISFKERVKLNKVHLETCQINTTAGHLSVTCTVRVLNLSYEKSVLVRHTTDNWHTHTDSLASYKPASCDGWSDKFTSTFSVTNQQVIKSAMQPGQRIIFAVRYTVDGDKVYWDSNGGLNYSIKCEPSP